jgi:hypothetical protein
MEQTRIHEPSGLGKSPRRLVLLQGDHREVGKSWVLRMGGRSIQQDHAEGNQRERYD